MPASPYKYLFYLIFFDKLPHGFFWMSLISMPLAVRYSKAFLSSSSLPSKINIAQPTSVEKEASKMFKTIS